MNFRELWHLILGVSIIIIGFIGLNWGLTQTRPGSDAPDWAALDIYQDHHNPATPTPEPPSQSIVLHAEGDRIRPTKPLSRVSL